MIIISTFDGDVELTGDKEAEFLAALPVDVVLPVDRVTARQFFIALDQFGFYDQVVAWVGTQSRKLQLSFNHAETFVKTDKMLVMGFKALQFTQQQIDDFFNAASLL